MEDLKMLRTTSKKALIDSALVMSHGDIEKAKGIIELYSSYLELPDFDVAPEPMIKQVKDTATNVFGWIKDNRDDIIGTIEYLKGFKSSKTSSPPISNSPIPKL